jgi:hypothetical protein
VTAPPEGGRPAGRSEHTGGWVTPAAARRVLVALHLSALAAVAIELLVPFADHAGEEGNGGHAVERIASLDFVGSYALYGFVGCVALVLVGKLLRIAVMRDERYYEERD